MAIKEFALTAVEARRFNTSPKFKTKQVKIDHSNTITNIAITEPGNAKIQFRYTVSYQGLGQVVLEGQLTYEGELVDLEETWNKDQRMPNKVAEQVHNTILSNGSFEVMLMARKLKLPPPIRMEIPRITVKDKDSTGDFSTDDLLKP